MAGTLDRTLYVLLAALIATLPFEFRSFPILSNLQWIFVAIAIVSIPVLVRERGRLLRDRLIIAAFGFVLTQWITALAAPEFTSNAINGAIRATAGFILLSATLCVRDPCRFFPIWTWTATLAGLYGLLDYAGFGIRGLFHETDFFVGPILRLSGSFEYPNTAAAFFGLSLPIVWTGTKSRWLRIVESLLVSLAMSLTYSRGAAIAVVELAPRLDLVLGQLAGLDRLGALTSPPMHP